MNNLEYLDYINLFREKAEQGKLVVFVGAGVSCNVAGMPDWNSLIQNMAQVIDYSRCNSCRHKRKNCESSCLLKNDYSADEFLKIPQYVFNRDKALYNQVLAESISDDIIVDAPLSSAIFDINPAHIITTNYDHLLEASKNVFCEQYQVIIHDKDLLNADKSKYIIKMHGDMNEPSTIVLKEQDYLDYSQKHVLIELFIKSLLTDHIVMFLGYSLNDYNIKLILSWLNYMRSQNDALDESRKIGYILLDQEDIDDTQQAYFNGNNIGVININQMPLTSEIPEALSNDRGKRLYSFLRVIANPHLEKNMFSVESAVQFLSKFAFLSDDQIMNLLFIGPYEVIDGQLRLFIENDYAKLAKFMGLNNAKSTALRQKLINAGITSVYFFDVSSTKHFSVGNMSDSSLVQNQLFNLYILDKYDELKNLLESGYEGMTSIEKCFYQSIISGYGDLLDTYSKIDPSGLQTAQKVAYLHNLATIDALQTRRFDTTKIKQFIQNIPLAKERNMFSEYLDLYNGNTKKRLTMRESLDKLKKDVGSRNTVHFGGTSITKIYEIKRLAIAQYFFYFYNYILFQGFEDLPKFFRAYIEAIICANSDVAEIPSYFGDMEFENEKYSIGYIDLDILTKFISPEDLRKLIETYHVKKLNVDKDTIAFLVECFQNLCNSIITAQTCGFRQSSFLVLSNLILLLNLVEIEENCKRPLETSILNLVTNETIMPELFSIQWPDFRHTLRNLSKLCQSLSLSCDFEVVKNIVMRKKFFEYAVNVNFGSLQQLIAAFIPSHDNNSSSEVQTIIDSTDNFNQKVILLRLFYKYISDETIKKSYQEFLSVNFLRLHTEAIYDFVFSEWIDFAPEIAERLLNRVLEMRKQQPFGMYQFPDPVETKLECIYLLHITNKITDISALEEMAAERPHLQFLLNPEQFDYTQVDFSNYMWVNFARQKKYMDYFVAHKDVIAPNIVNRIETNQASETEKKILYGFMLNEDEVLRM